MARVRNKITPARMIIKECQACTGTEKFRAVCNSTICYLSDYRTGEYLNHIQRIKRHCNFCSPDRRVELCEVESCPLFPFRWGVNPTLSEARRKDHEKYPQMGRGIAKMRS